MTDFEMLLDWVKHPGWRYCQKGKQCGNRMIVYYDALLKIAEDIKKGEYYPYGKSKNLADTANLSQQGTQC